MLRRAVMMAAVVAVGVSLASAQDRPTLAVIDFLYGGLSSGEEMIIYKRLCDELDSTGAFTVMDRMQRDNLLREKGINRIRNCNETRCLIEMGANVGAQKVVGGSISRLGLSFMATIRLVDVGTGREERTVSRSFPGSIEEFVATLNTVAEYLAGKAENVTLAADTTRAVSDNLGEVKRIKRGLSYDALGFLANFVKARDVKPAGGGGFYFELGLPIDNVAMLPGLQAWYHQHHDSTASAGKWRDYRFDISAELPLRWYFTGTENGLWGFAGAGFSFYYQASGKDYDTASSFNTDTYDAPGNFVALGLTGNAGLGFPIAGSLRGAVSLTARLARPMHVALNLEVPIQMGKKPEPKKEEPAAKDAPAGDEGAPQ